MMLDGFVIHFQHARELVRVGRTVEEGLDDLGPCRTTPSPAEQIP